MKRWIGILLTGAALPAAAQTNPVDSVSGKSHDLPGITVTAWKNTLSQKHGRADDALLPVDKLLEYLPGVTLIRRGNYALEPTIRGLSAAQINTTIDGMYVFGACTDRMDPVSSYVEPNNLKTITTSFGPGDESAGASVGGGLDFRLQKTVPGGEKTVSGWAGAGYETNGNARQFLGGLNLSKARWALGANGVFRQADNYRAGDGKEILFSQYRKVNFNVNGTVQLSDHHRLQADYLQDDGFDIGYPALTMDVAFAKAKMAALSHIYECGHRKLSRLETKVYGNFIDHAMDDTKRPESMVPIHMDMPGTSQTVGFYTRASLRVGERHHLTLMANGYHNRLYAEMTMYPKGAAEMFMLTLPDVERTMVGFSGNDRVRIGEKTTLTVGATLNATWSGTYSIAGRQTLSSLFPEIPVQQNLLVNAFAQVEQRFSPTIRVYGGVARGERAASLQELYAFYLFNRLDNHDYLGNQDLKTEKSWNANLGADFRKGKLLFSPQVYAYRFADYIVGRLHADYSVMTIGASGVKQYQNIPNAVLYGGELAVRWRPTQTLEAQSTTSVSYAYDNNNQLLPLIPPLKSINRVSFRKAGWAAFGEGIFGVGRKHTSAVYGERPSPGFALFNAGVGKDLSIKEQSISLNVRVDNVLDAAFYEHLDLLKILRPGRNVIFHVLYRF